MPPQAHAYTYCIISRYVIATVWHEARGAHSYDRRTNTPKTLNLEVGGPSVAEYTPDAAGAPTGGVGNSIQRIPRRASPTPAHPVRSHRPASATVLVPRWSRPAVRSVSGRFPDRSAPRYTGYVSRQLPTLSASHLPICTPSTKMSDEVLDSVKKCVAVIKGAKTDTEKFAALFMVTKTVKAEKCNARSKLALFDAVEFKFIKRLLLSDDVPAGCPPFVYKSVAMSILTALCSVQEVATHQEILQNVDVFLDIVLGAEDEDEDEADEDNLMLVNEAYKCLNVIAQFEQGMRALFDVDAVGKMCKVYSQKSFQTDEALSLLVAIVEKFGPPSWENNVPNFNTLMNILTVDFETDHSDRKFKLCSILSPLLGNCPVEIAQNTCDDEIWPTKMFLGLRDILTSKLVKAQRDPAIKLAAQMLTTFGAEWSLQDEAKPKAFFLLLIHLASIEIRMLLEDKKFEQVNHQYTYIF